MPKNFSPFVALALLAASITAQAAPFVNGGFEAGSLPPWTIIYPTTSDSAGHTPSDVINISSGATDVHGGAYGVGIRNPGWTNNAGAVIGVIGMISQDFDTVAGQSYQLSYWLKILNNASGTDLGVAAWGDANAGCNWAAIIPNNQTGVPCGVVTGSWILDPADSNWVQYNFVVTAQSIRSTIVLAGRSDFSRVSFDDVTLTPASAAPEPGTLALLGLGLAGLASTRRRRQ
jgi:hypothetical protein